MTRRTGTARRSKNNKSFYTVDNFLAGTAEKPIRIYENGVVEVPTVLRVKNYLGRQYYEGLKRNLSRLRYKRRDLRGDFRPRNHRTYLFEVLGSVRNQRSVSVSKLWKFFYRDEVESIISAISEAIVFPKWTRLVRKAFRERDSKFLESIGYVTGK